MSDNIEFDKALDNEFGKGFAKSLKCQECGSDTIHCPHCNETLCPNGCDDK